MQQNENVGERVVVHNRCAAARQENSRRCQARCVIGRGWQVNGMSRASAAAVRRTGFVELASLSTSGMLIQQTSSTLICYTTVALRGWLLNNGGNSCGGLTIG